MKKLHKEIIISAPRTHVAAIMLQESTYREWTKVFNPTSYFEGSWEEGSVIKFLGRDESTGEIGGMYSRIKEHRPAEFVSIEHVGMVNPDGSIDTTSDMVKSWTPAFENYTFNDVEGGTQVTVDMDVNEEYQEMFEGLWPKALQSLKELSEA